MKRCVLAAAAAAVTFCSVGYAQEEVKGTPPGSNSALDAASGAPEPQQGSVPGQIGSTRGDVPPARDIDYPGTLTLKVDLTDLERRVFNVHETIPVRPGPLTLLYPEWLPGNHAARGPIESLAGLMIAAAGHPLAWQRDPLNVYAFHLQVPPGASHLELDFEFASPLIREQGRTVVTPELLGLQWNTVVLYPAGYYVARIAVQASVTVPEGWELASALEQDSRHGAAVRFKPVSLETLVDSPLFAGRFTRTLDLDPGSRTPVHLDLFADSPELLEVRPQQLAAHRKLVQETYALYGPPHYDHYDFLLALSEHFGEVGLEHHRSSENRRPPGYFLEWDRLGPGRYLLPHEFSHAWNGKLRRPAGLTTPDFNAPIRNSLLWVYEGLTNYYGDVLAARSGLWTEQFAREAFASLAANMDRNRAGRAWRDLEDTTAQPIITPRRPLSWLSWQRTEDYYTEGELLWLDVDTRIREQTGGKHSLDDFTRSFFGGTATTSTGPLTYSETDVMQALQALAPFDWQRFLSEHLHGHAPGAPLDGLARGGWKLVYAEVPSEYSRSLDDQRRVLDLSYSIGLTVSVQTGQLTEVRWGGPAYEAGLTMGTLLVAVNGREYHPERLRVAIALAKLNKQPIELLVKNLDRYRTVRIAYFEGLKYPQLQRLENTEDRLADILKPRVETK